MNPSSEPFFPGNENTHARDTNGDATNLLEESANVVDGLERRRTDGEVWATDLLIAVEAR